MVSFILHAPWSTFQSPTPPFTPPVGGEVGTRKHYNSNMNFGSSNFREIKKITCGSSRGLSQMVKVDECQDTVTTQLEISHLSKSGLSEAELILSRAGH